MYPYNPPPRPARSPLVYVLVGCAVLGSCGGIFGGCAFWFLRSRSNVHAQPVPSGNGTIQVPPVPIDNAPVADTPPAPEDSTVPAGTPAASLRARPAWGKIDHLKVPKTTDEYAPQLDKAQDAFMSAAPIGNEPLDHALVVCRVQTFAKADTFAGDDLHVKVAIGTNPRVANDGPEDANLAFVSAPLVTLKKGDAVRFEVYDRDVFSMQDICKPQTKWNGGPLTILDAGATIECRALTGETLGKHAMTRAAAADQALAKVRTTHKDLGSPTWGLPITELDAARREIGDVAGMIGWDDARTKRRVSRYDQVVAGIDAQKPALFAELHPKGKDAVTVKSVTFTKQPMTCNSSGDGCTIKLTAKNDGADVFVSTTFQFYAATAKSGPRAVGVSFKSPAPGQLANGASQELLFEPSPELALGAGPSIFGVCREQRCEILTLK